MKITENVHVIRIDFQVTPQVKRYVNIYLLVGKACYLIDSGVAGSEKVLEKYLNSIGRKLTDIKSVFLTHSHPDHIGDAIPVANDLPIFVDYVQSLHSLDKIGDLRVVKYYCPAWDDICSGEQMNDVLDTEKNVLFQLRDAVQKVEAEHEEWDEKEKLVKILEQAGILQYAGNPLVVKSIEACKKD